ncbi:MAG: response regulator transcription factor [Syntrophomonadaceae bacterium]|nr:response regulator transcription factor [Syntrophomonadaceae bacterium]
MINLLMVLADNDEAQKIYEVLRGSKCHFDCYCAHNAPEALKMLDENKMELIILDADLRDGSGLELAQQIRRLACYQFTWIIFLSRDNQYEVEAYRKIRCYDFVVKPYHEELLLATVEMLSRYKITDVSEDDRVVVTFKHRDSYLRIPARDILYFEVFGNNSTLYTYTEEYLLKKMSLRRIKLMLPKYFVQCHKSFIVNRNYIESIQKGPYGWEIRLKDYDRAVPSGDKYKGNITMF